jgi:hypothetical protein
MFPAPYEYLLNTSGFDELQDLFERDFIPLDSLSQYTGELQSRNMRVEPCVLPPLTFYTRSVKRNVIFGVCLELETHKVFSDRWDVGLLSLLTITSVIFDVHFFL